VRKNTSVFEGSPELGSTALQVTLTPRTFRIKLIVFAAKEFQLSSFSSGLHINYDKKIIRNALSPTVKRTPQSVLYSSLYLACPSHLWFNCWLHVSSWWKWAAKCRLERTDNVSSPANTLGRKLRTELSRRRRDIIVITGVTRDK
jgi:hypothetical protein